MLSLLITLEQKLGRFAIPALLRIIITLQVVVWLLLQLGEGGTGLFSSLVFSPLAIQEYHQWWRLISFLVIPTGGGILWLIMMVPFMWMISDGMEEAWGSFRVNLYLFACVVCVATEGLLHQSMGVTSWPILLSMIMAYAIYYPDQAISLYGIIPLKMKWIGWMDFGFLVFNFLRQPDMRWHILASLIPFFVVFGPAMSQLLHHKVKTFERRQRYVAAQRPEGDSLHRCSRCGKSEKDNPQLDFRVDAQGEDVCSECRAKS